MVTWTSLSNVGGIGQKVKMLPGRSLSDGVGLCLWAVRLSSDSGHFYVPGAWRTSLSPVLKGRFMPIGTGVLSVKGCCNLALLNLFPLI